MSGSTSTTTTTSIPNGTSTNVELAEETVNKEAAAVTTSLTTSVASDSTDGATKEKETSWFGCCGSDRKEDEKPPVVAPVDVFAPGETMKILEGHENGVNSVDYSSDGRFVVSVLCGYGMWILVNV